MLNRQGFLVIQECFKVLFLVAITSTRRISELSALSVAKHLCIFHKYKVVLRTDPSFLPKVLSHFHVQQELVLPIFCPDSKHPKEKARYTLDVRRVLKVYIQMTKDIRSTDYLFVSLHLSSMGKKVTSFTRARWIWACISLAYESLKLPQPTHTLAHSIRSAAALATFAANIPLLLPFVKQLLGLHQVHSPGITEWTCSLWLMLLSATRSFIKWFRYYNFSWGKLWHVPTHSDHQQPL